MFKRSSWQLKNTPPRGGVFYVNRIPADGLHEEVSYDPKTLDVERFDVRVEDPITVSSFITKAEEEVVVQAEIRGTLQLSCAKCLETFERPLRSSTTLSYQVKPADVVDITDDIRQEIILAYPMVPVCQDACKGLCPVCGQSLNVEILPHTCPGKISDGGGDEDEEDG